jgi:FtsH-binding integral membrane protein
MSDFNPAYARGHAGALDTSVDAGLRAFMLGVYNKMALGLLLSAALAYVVGSVAPVTALVFGTPLIYVVQWGPIALLFGSMFFMRNPSPSGSAVLYWSVVSLIGMGMGVWVMIALNSVEVTSVGGRTIGVTFGTIAQALVITAAAFGGLSLWGYTTKRNLTGLSSFMFMAVIGLILISVSNFFFRSPMLEIGIQVVGLGLFSFITAMTTQQLKVSYFAYQGDNRSLAVMTNFGALNLYISFINMFQFLLMLMGGSRN